MIQPIGFLDTSSFTAGFVHKYRERMAEGVLYLRQLKEGDEEASDLPIVKEWRAARALLSRLRTGAAPYLKGEAAILGKAWIETLPPESVKPWNREDDDYVRSHFRTRTTLIPAPGAWSHSGGVSLCLAVGSVNLTDPTLFSSEVNFGDYARTHLVVDIQRPAAIADEP